MIVGELVEILQAENRTLNVEVYIDDLSSTFGPITSVEVYEDVVELWIR